MVCIGNIEWYAWEYWVVCMGILSGMHGNTEWYAWEYWVGILSGMHENIEGVHGNIDGVHGKHWTQASAWLKSQMSSTLGKISHKQNQRVDFCWPSSTLVRVRPKPDHSAHDCSTVIFILHDHVSFTNWTRQVAMI